MDPLVTLAITTVTITTPVTLGYAGLCWVKPFTTCKRCRGTGRTTTRVLHRPRTCRRCDRGQRLRTGRRVYNYLHHARESAR